MYINLQPSALIGRGYDSADGYANKDPYSLVFSVALLGNGEAYVHAMNGGRVTLSVIGEIAKKLYEEYDVTEVIAERNSRRQRYSIVKILERLKLIER